MFLVESEALAAHLPDVRTQIERIDAMLIDMDSKAVLRPSVWAPHVGAGSPVVDRIFEAYTAHGVLIVNEFLECACGNLRAPDRPITECSSCGRELPDREVETPTRAFVISENGNKLLTEIRRIREQLARTRRLKLLVVSSSPANAAPLRIDQEYRELCEAVSDHADVKPAFAVRFNELQGLILEERPDLIHFSLHGVRNEHVLFESADGKVDPISHNALCDVLVLSRDRSLLLVFASCHSEALGRKLIEFTPIVVAMSHAVGDHAAIAFTKAFYRALVRGELVRVAFSHGVTAMKTTGVGDHDVPVLLTHRAIDLETATLGQTRS